MTAARKLPPPAPSRDPLVQKLLASPVESATEEERHAIETAMRMPVVDGVVVTAELRRRAGTEEPPPSRT